jgi:hypothetical protein
VLPRGGKTSHSCRVQQGSEVEFTDCGTNRTCAHAAIADAAFARSRGDGCLAVQEISPKRPFYQLN